MVKFLLNLLNDLKNLKNPHSSGFLFLFTGHCDNSHLRLQLIPIIINKFHKNALKALETISFINYHKIYLNQERPIELSPAMDNNLTNLRRLIVLSKANTKN
jgi:hypothetical protein